MPNNELPDDFTIKLNALELGFVTALVYNWRIDNTAVGQPITAVYQKLYEKLTKVAQDEIYVKNPRDNRKV